MRSRGYEAVGAICGRSETLRYRAWCPKLGHGKERMISEWFRKAWSIAAIRWQGAKQASSRRRAREELRALAQDLTQEERLLIQEELGGSIDGEAILNHDLLDYRLSRVEPPDGSPELIVLEGLLRNAPWLSLTLILGPGGRREVSVHPPSGEELSEDEREDMFRRVRALGRRRVLLPGGEFSELNLAAMGADYSSYAAPSQYFVTRRVEGARWAFLGLPREGLVVGLDSGNRLAFIGWLEMARVRRQGVPDPATLSFVDVALRRARHLEPGQSLRDLPQGWSVQYTEWPDSSTAADVSLSNSDAFARLAVSFPSGEVRGFHGH